MEAIQTLLKPAKQPWPVWENSPQPSAASDVGPAAVCFVVSADERWLHATYEATYEIFVERVGDQARPLGHLFLDKLFQLHLRMPEVDEGSMRRFGRHILGVKDPHSSDSLSSADESSMAFAARVEDIDEAKEQIRQAATLEEKGEIARAASEEAHPELLITLAEEAARPEVHEATEHELEPFLDMLDRNPRSVKRFVNAYLANWLINQTHSEARVEQATLARWTVIELRWPELAELLRHDPEQATQLLNHSYLKRFHGAIDHATLRAVVGADEREAMTADAIRQCCGLPSKSATRPIGPTGEPSADGQAGQSAPTSL